MKKIILTCEHAGNKVPTSYKNLFKNYRLLLNTHQGLDIGALAIAKDLQKHLKAPLIFSEVTRLLVDLNRFRRSKSLFSEVTAKLSRSEKLQILKEYYEPHWDQVLTNLKTLHKSGSQIFHIAVHSMTDNLNGQIRNMQLALLYDPRRPSEKKFSALWIAELKIQFPTYKVARNNPYKGTSEGVTCFSRIQFNDQSYVGIELEINQGLLQAMTVKQRKAFSTKLAHSLKAAVHKL